MKKRPDTTAPQVPEPYAYQAPGQAPHQTNASETGDAIETWIASGGATTFLVNEGSGFDPTFDGVQLLASYFVPRGRTAWIKQIRVAPYCPAPLCNPWQGWPANWQDFEPVGAAVSPFRATAQQGVYETPMGWESYFDTSTEVLPTWEWWITVIPQSLGSARAAAGAGVFSLIDPASWYLAESIPVPASVYRGGVPGRTPGGRFEPQRMQVLQAAAINWHLQIPEQNCALLWCRWRQSTVQVRTRDINGSALVLSGVPPLLPSFGQMVGYSQATSSPATVENARHGWGG